MPLVIKKIEGKFLDNYVSNIPIYSMLSATIQNSDYINVNGEIFFLQNYSKVNTLTQGKTLLSYGLKNNYNLPTSVLQLSY